MTPTTEGSTRSRGTRSAAGRAGRVPGARRAAGRARSRPEGPDGRRTHLRWPARSPRADGVPRSLRRLPRSVSQISVRAVRRVRGTRQQPQELRVQLQDAAGTAAAPQRPLRRW